MITDKTLDEALVELLRCQRALEALRKERKAEHKYCPLRTCKNHLQKFNTEESRCVLCGYALATSVSGPTLHAAAKRASMDLTRKLAALRTGR